MKDKKSRIVRQNLDNRIIHWAVALSTFVLLITGFGQMPMYKRYGVASLPGLGWTADFHLTLTIHYIAGAVLIFAGVYHLVYMLLRREFEMLPKRGDFKESILVIGSMCKLCEAPTCHKYLGEQRLAYAYIGVNLIVVAVTGLFKVYKNAPGIDLSHTTMQVVTNLHNLTAVMLVFGILGHLAAFAFSENRALLPAMFTGCVDLEYVKQRHAHWYNDLLLTPEKLRKSLCAHKKGLNKNQETA